MSKFFGIGERRPFEWGDLGNIGEGRVNLGDEMPVVVYRLMQFTLIDVLSNEFDYERAQDFMRKAGHLAGKEFSKQLLNLKLDFDPFIAHLQEMLKVLKIGILRVERACLETGEMVLTVAEDLDCSGLPVADVNICVYDEGFLSGVLECYTNKKYAVKEVDCWASGDRVCRFEANPIKEK